MSAILDNLEDLDNKELRAKCLEYGLPNIPITDTSRKLLIKRLRTAMQGDTKPAEKSKSRRETIHVIKVEMESTKEKETPKETPTKGKTSRRTIGNISASIEEESSRETPTKSKTSRRTIGNVSASIEKEPSRETPTKSKISRRTIGNVSASIDEEPPARATVTQRRPSGRTTPISQLEPVVSYSSKRKVSDVIEEDDEESISIPVIVEKSSEINRQTRAPSLSKSPVVTTSYVKDTSHDIIEELEDTEPEELEEEEEIEEIELEREQVKPKYPSISRTYDTSKPFAPSSDKVPTLNYSSNRINQPTSRMTLSKAPTSTFSYESSATRRYTTGGYNTSTDGDENRTFVHHMDTSENIEKDDPLESPYLSDFARRLSRLKAEPLDAGSKTPLKAEVTRREVPRYYSGPISARRGISQSESVGESFKRFLIALDQKYHLKRNFTIAAIILIIILIYVLFY